MRMADSCQSPITHYKGFRSASARRPNYDYSQAGAYFITICTANRCPYFGSIITPDQDPARAYLDSTPLADIALAGWNAIPEYYGFAAPGAFVVMPDHIHGILLFERSVDHPAYTAPIFGPQRDNLAAVVRGYKAGLSKWARQAGLTFGWQSRYHDRVIRSDYEQTRIEWYIEQNPARWADEHLNADGLFR